MEEWRDVKGYEGRYQVSNTGKVKSLERTVWNGKVYYKIPERILKPQMHRNGYLHVGLYKEGKMKNYFVQQLVATAFCENPHNYKEVNHISEDKTDNSAKNLEWVSHKYNCSYGTRNKRAAEKLSKPVYGINKVSGLIVEFPSAMEASRQLGIYQGNITLCCNGKRKSTGGFYWHYVESEEVANE